MKKYNQFEIFRFIGAFSVLFFHVVKFDNNIPVLFKNGPIWVYFFFLLSGFLLSYSYSKREINIKKFYLTRLFKFYPLYIFSLMLLFKLSGKMIYHIFLIQSWVFGKALNYNSSAWYLSTFSFLIIIFPFLKKIQKKYPKMFFFIAVLLNFYTYYVYISFINYSNIDFIHHAINYFPLMHIATFVFGMELAKQVEKLKSKKYYSYIVVLYFIFLSLFNQYNVKIPYVSTLVTLSFFPLIVFLILDDGIVSNFLGNNFFVYLGSLSFSIYILHIPMYFLYKKYISEINNYENFIIFFVLIIIISNFTKYFIEIKYYNFLCKKYNV